MKIINYIAVEGLDRTGKSTITKALVEKLEERPTLYTFEPNADLEVCANLRSMCLNKRFDNMITPVARELMMLANRSVHHEVIVKPHLDNGYLVVSDRSFISGAVYAEVASKMDFETWWDIARHAITVVPDLIIHVTNKNPSTEVNETDIYDDEKEEFKNKIRSTFESVLKNVNVTFGIPVLPFENDFTKTVEENSTELHDRLVQLYDLN